MGPLCFTPGETEKTVSVAVLDDAHDEGRETVKMWLWGVRGLSAAQMTDPYATGTIVNSDPLQRAWLARFGPDGGDPRDGCGGWAVARIIGAGLVCDDGRLPAACGQVRGGWGNAGGQRA